MENRELATLAGGCFWCLEAAFADLAGVEKVESGYSGGQVERPTYEEVCTGRTGHAEVVQVTFDPSVLPYRDLLGAYFAIHDPTTLDRQGADVGTQYRSSIFWHDEAQKRAAEAAIAELAAQGIWNDPIVTRVERFEAFYPAGDYHRDYFARHPDQPYCQAVVAPKVAKFRKQFLGRLKKAKAGEA